MTTKLAIKRGRTEISLEAESAEDAVRLLKEASEVAFSGSAETVSEDESEFDESGTPEGKEQAKKGTARRVAKPVTVNPLPLDLKGKGGGVSLRDFLAQKKPEEGNFQEITVVCAYYLAKNLKMTTFQPGHLVACYNELGSRKPTNLPQLLKDAKRRKGWLEPVGDEGAWQVTVAGENYVEHDLPRKA